MKMEEQRLRDLEQITMRLDERVQVMAKQVATIARDTKRSSQNSARKDERWEAHAQVHARYSRETDEIKQMIRDLQIDVTQNKVSLAKLFVTASLGGVTGTLVAELIRVITAGTP